MRRGAHSGTGRTGPRSIARPGLTGMPKGRVALGRSPAPYCGRTAAVPAEKEPAPMKLVTAIVHNEDAATLVDALLEKEYRATRVNSSGGFLKQGNATILVGVEDDQVDAVLEIISANCHSRKQFVNPMPPIMEPGEFYMPYPVEVEVGGATVFVLPVERFERL
jgi:uncharacterized protein YaaQ